MTNSQKGKGGTRKMMLSSCAKKKKKEKKGYSTNARELRDMICLKPTVFTLA